MFFAVRGKEAILKCNECSAYFSLAGFWPPRFDLEAHCPECDASVEWVQEKSAPDRPAELFLKWRKEEIHG